MGIMNMAAATTPESLKQRCQGSDYARYKSIIKVIMFAKDLLRCLQATESMPSAAIVAKVPMSMYIL